MDDMTHDAFANRDEPIPVIRIPSRSTAPASPQPDEKQRTRDKVKDSASKLKGKLEEYGTADTRQSVQDRLFNGIMSQIIPPEEMGSDDDEDQTARALGSPQSPTKKDRRSRQYVDRPGFSIPLMSANFRRFNARIGIIFVLQNRLIRLFNWSQPTATLSFLATYSLLCLEPHLLPILPLVLLLLWVMIPSFLARHPAPKNDPRVEPSYRGPPLAPASRVRPAPEMSKDFFRNMRDLQNCMEDFSAVHDAANEFVTPYTNFSDEGVSSLLFVSLSALACVAFLAAHLVPWRFVALSTGWIATLSGHPRAQEVLLSEDILSQIRQHCELLASKLRAIIESDILLDSPPDRREVEIFELQKFHPYSDTWEPWLFSPSPYDPLSPARIAGARAKGTQFFEDVSPPAGWAWRSKKWFLDLASREWVEERMITGVEIETEGERWVYDLPDEAVTGGADGLGSPKAKKAAKQGPKSGWEEGVAAIGRGEWRRRRWVRVVERKIVVESGAGNG